jgi:hypothetical protein
VPTIDNDTSLLNGGHTTGRFASAGFAHPTELHELRDKYWPKKMAKA